MQLLDIGNPIVYHTGMERATDRVDLLEERLQQYAIPIQDGAIIPDSNQCITFPPRKDGKIALVSVWYRSDVITDEEAQIISRFARARSREFPGEVEGIYAKDANTIILRKLDNVAGEENKGLWTYRRQRTKTDWSKNYVPLIELLTII